MPERHTRTETWKVGAPLKVGATTVVPIARVFLHTASGEGFAWLTASKDPQAIVVRDGEGTRAIGASDSTITLEMLRERIPDLDLVLASPDLDREAT